MKNDISRSRRRAPSRENGVALVLTLGILAVMLLVVMGFAISMRTEQAAARNYNHVIVARQLAHAAVDEAIYLVRTNTPIIGASGFYATQPGRAVRKGGTSLEDRLFSVAAPPSSAGTVNLNSDYRIIMTNRAYLVTQSHITADWINVCTNGQSTNAPIVGRYAFWVDDEATKININAANRTFSTNAMLGGFVSTPRDISLTNLTTTFGSTPGVLITPATADNSWNYGQGSGFFTIDQWTATSGIGAGTYNRNQSYVTVYSEVVDLSPTGTPKLNINAVNQADIDNPRNSLGHPGFATVFGKNFFDKYGTYGLYVGDSNVVKQIMANISDFTKPGSGGVITNTGAQPGYLASDGNTNNIPRYYLGLRRQPFLNEIGVQVEYYWYNDGSGCCFMLGSNKKLGALIRVAVELVNPYNTDWTGGGEVTIGPDRFQYWLNGPGWSSKWGPHGTGGGWFNPQSVSIPTIPARSYYTLYLPAFKWDNIAPCDCNAYVSDAYVKLGRARILTTAGNANTICDWASGQDFSSIPATNNWDLPNTDGPQPQFYFISPNIHANWSSDPVNNPVTPWFQNGRQQGIAKNDPRVRTFTDWTPPVLAWHRVGYDVANPMTIDPASAQKNSVVNFTGGTGITGIPNDEPDPGGAMSSQSTFFIKAGNTATNYESLTELGYIHTGLQWRTLRLHPAAASELSAGLIPDWAMLDMFTLTNQPSTPIRGKININAAAQHGASATAGRRSEPVMALLSAVSSNIMVGLTNSILTSQWHPGSSWPTYRENTTTYNMKPGLYYSLGELCELTGIATNSSSYYATNDVSITLGRFVNAATVRSDQFTVWAIGQAIQDVNKNGTFDPGTDLIVAESKVQAVIERIQNAGTVSYVTKYFRYVSD